MIVGIDPGLSGAVVRYDPLTGNLIVHDVPTFQLTRNGKSKREIDLVSLARIMDDLCSPPGTRVIVEQVSSMPGQGVSSVFAFGKAYGILLGVAASTFCPVETVTPAVWKRAMGVTASKDGARARASALLPQHAYNWTRAKDDGRAEAALIALYGLRRENA